MYQHVLTKPIACLRGQKCISKCFDKPPPMTPGTQSASQHVLIKPLPCQRVHKIYLNLCGTNQSHASEDTKYISN
jgi:hypothetical protein